MGLFHEAKKVLSSGIIGGWLIGCALQDLSPPQGKQTISLQEIFPPLESIVKKSKDFFHLAISLIRKQCEQYADTCLEEIMEEYRILGIPDAAKPHISFDFFLPGLYGCYYPEQDQVVINPQLSITPEETFFGTFTEYFLGERRRNLKHVLRHELGHFYADKLSELQGLGSWPPMGGLLLEVYVGRRIVSEGIAEYFERRVSGEPDTFEDEEWPKKPHKEDFSVFDHGSIYYNGGYHLVKPILDRYGLLGISCLIEREPSPNELWDLPKYRKKIMEDLSEIESLVIAALPGYNIGLHFNHLDL